MQHIGLKKGKGTIVSDVFEIVYIVGGVGLLLILTDALYTDKRHICCHSWAAADSGASLSGLLGFHLLAQEWQGLGLEQDQMNIFFFPLGWTSASALYHHLHPPQVK